MEKQLSKLNLSRRNALKLGAGFLGTGALATALGLDWSNPQPIAAQNNITPDEALAKLMEGNKRFIEQTRIKPNQDIARLMEVAEGQKPFAAILSCADSRVPTEIVFDQGFGDLFVVRDAGNVATSEEIGSLEFGTLVLGAKVIMVIGHESCGAVKAAMENPPVPGSIGKILEHIKPAVKDFQGQQNDLVAVKKATKSNVFSQIEKLKASPVISKLINEGVLKVIGAYYSLKNGKIEIIT